MHSLVPSFFPSFLYLQLDVCSHKIWCTHHLQMSLQLPGESISFTNISDRGREFQRSWQTRCSSSRYFQTAVKMVICSYKYVCRHYVIQWCCYNYWLCFGRNGKSTSIQTQDWVYPVLTSSKKHHGFPWLFPTGKSWWWNERTKEARFEAPPGWPRWEKDAEICREWPCVIDVTFQLWIFHRCRQLVCVFLLVQGCDEKLKTIEAN